MTTKRTTDKGTPPGVPDAGPEDQAEARSAADWHTSVLGRIAAEIDDRHTLIWPMVKASARLSSDESMIVSAWLENAEDKFLDGDDEGAANALVTAAVSLGLLARFSDEAREGVQRMAGHALADKTHLRDRLAKETALRIWRDERATFRNKDDAAPKIAVRDGVHMSPSTVRRWLRGV